MESVDLFSPAVNGQKLDPSEEGTRAEAARETPVSTRCTLSSGRDSAPCPPSGAALAGSAAFGGRGVLIRVNNDTEMRVQRAAGFISRSANLGKAEWRSA